mmetsp:Transcript_23268/g.20148  ORF Transcript_23268/g.20148 Transcript_23268/m.20148 type:complete len:115 (+) Transcript_23268:656-1000(+)
MISKKIAEILDKKLGPKKIKNLIKDHEYSFDDSKVIDRARFKPTEDRIIVKYVSEHGLEWAKISSMLPGKAPLMIKNRYYYLKKRGAVEDIENELLERDELELNQVPSKQDGLE